MHNVLAIDIGNTNITAGVFKDDRLAAKEKIPTGRHSLYNKAAKRILDRAGLSPEEVGGVIISSVAPLALARFISSLSGRFDCRARIIGRDVKVPIKNLYKARGEVGQDRLVNAYAAKVLYGAPAVIIDFGTAITFDLLSGRGEYLGGLIMPGIGMGLAALYEKTALLPKVELKAARRIIGRDTVESMRGGILFGYGAMCGGLASQYRRLLGARLKVIATGGNAALISRYAKSIQVVDEDLTLKGLYLVGRKL